MMVEVILMKRELHAERLLAGFVEKWGVNDFNFFQKVNTQGVRLFEYLPVPIFSSLHAMQIEYVDISCRRVWQYIFCNDQHKVLP